MRCSTPNSKAVAVAEAALEFGQEWATEATIS